MQEKGLAIVQYMRRYLDARSERTHMNYSLLATPAEGLSGRFVRMDKKRYGLIPGVTDKDYYTNSFPVSYTHLLASILQPDKILWHYAIHVKTSKPI